MTTSLLDELRVAASTRTANAFFDDLGTAWLEDNGFLTGDVASGTRMMSILAAYMFLHAHPMSDVQKSSAKTDGVEITPTEAANSLLENYFNSLHAFLSALPARPEDGTQDKLTDVLKKEIRYQYFASRLAERRWQMARIMAFLLHARLQFIGKDMPIPPALPNFLKEMNLRHEKMDKEIWTPIVTAINSRNQSELFQQWEKFKSGTYGKGLTGIRAPAIFSAEVKAVKDDIGNVKSVQCRTDGEDADEYVDDADTNWV